MRSIASILLVLLTVTQTPLGQLLKLPVLMEHFNKHQENEGVSFLEFLNEHYSKEHNDADHSEDEKLPFKSMTLQSPGFAIVTAIFNEDAALNFTVPGNIILNEFYTPQQHLFAIFHPPRA